MTYKHTQTGWLSLGGIALGILVLAVVGVMTRGWVELTIPASLLAVIGSQLAQMTVSVEQGKLKVESGTGHLQKVIDLKDVEACEAVRNHWLMGWGLRWIPGGWLINVSGLDAVELTYRAGGKLQIGTDEPWQLADAVQAEMENL